MPDARDHDGVGVVDVGDAGGVPASKPRLPDHAGSGEPDRIAARLDSGHPIRAVGACSSLPVDGEPAGRAGLGGHGDAGERGPVVVGHAAFQRGTFGELDLHVCVSARSEDDRISRVEVDGVAGVCGGESGGRRLAVFAEWLRHHDPLARRDGAECEVAIGGPAEQLDPHVEVIDGGGALRDGDDPRFGGLSGRICDGAGQRARESEGDADTCDGLAGGGFDDVCASQGRSAVVRRKKSGRLGWIEPDLVGLGGQGLARGAVGAVGGCGGDGAAGIAQA